MYFLPKKPRHQPFESTTSAEVLQSPVASPMRHFVCDECLETQVRGIIGQSAAEIAHMEHLVSCGLCNTLYSERDLLLHLSNSVFKDFLSARATATEYLIQHRLEQDISARVQSQAAKLAKLSSEERGWRHHHEQIASEILTLRCPRPDCRQAFVDFVNCWY